MEEIFVDFAIIGLGCCVLVLNYRVGKLWQERNQKKDVAKGFLKEVFA